MDALEAIAGLIFPDAGGEHRVLEEVVFQADIAEELLRGYAQLFQRHQTGINQQIVQLIDLHIAAEEPEKVAGLDTRGTENESAALGTLDGEAALDPVIHADGKDIGEGNAAFIG